MPLLEEIWVCTQYMKGVTYSDVLAMPTYERRYFLGLLTKQNKEREEQYEEIKNSSKSSGKGTRTSTVSGEALKSKMKSGDIPTS